MSTATHLFTLIHSIVYFQLVNGTYGVVAHDVRCGLYFIIIVRKQ